MIDTAPKVTVKKQITKGKPHTLYKIFKEKYLVFSDCWETVQTLLKKGYDIKLIEKERKVGKRKPITVTEVWVRK